MTEEENLDLAERLGLDGDVMIMSAEADQEPVVGDGFSVVLVGGDDVIVATHGWGSSGAYIDVHTYTGVDDPQPTTPVLVVLEGEVTIYAQTP